MSEAKQLRQAIKEMQDRYKEIWDTGTKKTNWGFVAACDVASDLDNILLVQVRAKG